MTPPRCYACATEMVAEGDGRLGEGLATKWVCPHCPESSLLVPVELDLFSGARVRVDQAREEDEL